MTDVSVRVASAGDAQLIATLTRACWRNTVAIDSAGHHESAATVDAQLQHGGGFILVAQRQAIGSVRWLHSPDTPSMIEVARMGVLPAWRGQQLAAVLLQAVLAQAQRDNRTELRAARNRSRRVCRRASEDRHGGRTTGRSAQLRARRAVARPRHDDRAIFAPREIGGAEWPFRSRKFITDQLQAGS